MKLTKAEQRVEDTLKQNVGSYISIIPSYSVESMDNRTLIKFNTSTWKSLKDKGLVIGGFNKYNLSTLLVKGTV